MYKQTKMNDITKECLFFKLNTLLKTLTCIADKAFLEHGVSSSYAYMIILIKDNPKIGTVDLSKKLNLKPSTITRLVDKMVMQGYLVREHSGKRASISCTAEGVELSVKLFTAWESLRDTVADSIGGNKYTQLGILLDYTEESLQTSEEK